MIERIGRTSPILFRFFGKNLTLHTTTPARLPAVVAASCHRDGDSRRCPIAPMTLVFEDDAVAPIESEAFAFPACGKGRRGSVSCRVGWSRLQSVELYDPLPRGFWAIRKSPLLLDDGPFRDRGYCQHTARKRLHRPYSTRSTHGVARYRVRTARTRLDRA
jgi:hypothetical protein